MPWDDQSALFYKMQQEDTVGLAQQVVDRRDHLQHVERGRVVAQKAFHEIVVTASDRGITNSDLAELSGISVAAISKILKTHKD